MATNVPSHQGKHALSSAGGYHVSNTFAARLNLLFDTAYSPGRGPHASVEVVTALRDEGITMSAPYLSQLRSGARRNPSNATMAAVARFFRIKVAYFTDEAYCEKLTEELILLAHMRDEGVRRLTARSIGLSPNAQGGCPCSRRRAPPT